MEFLLELRGASPDDWYDLKEMVGWQDLKDRIIFARWEMCKLLTSKSKINKSLEIKLKDIIETLSVDI